MRMAPGRKAVLAVGAMVGALVGATGLAWACTAVPSIVSVAPAAAPAGTPVTVRGQAVWGAGRVLELRWDGVKGPVLAQSDAGKVSALNFSMTAPIPADASPGVHYLVAVPVDSSQGLFAGGSSVGRASIEVTGSQPSPSATRVGAPSSASPAQLWHGAAPRPDGSTSLMVGAGMLGLGTAGLLSGFGLVVVRRRRATHPAG